MMATAACAKVALLLLLLLGAGLLVAAIPGSAHAATDGWFDYDRNGTNDDGRLYWKWFVNGPPIYSVDWRAGSGKYLDDRTNGWLPSGWYSIKGHWNNYDAAINGRVWYLSDKVSQKTGALRTELFIHTEETPSNGQNASYEPERWDGPSDYISLGCVKVSYGNMPGVHNRWTNYGGSTAHGSGSPYPLSSQLYVHN